MNENIKFSIILPVYNVEKYMEKSLNSIINQTYKNLEIICVNDNSTDKSLEILKEYSSKDSRFVIIDQKENKGPGYARNIAIEKATGDYISFLDPDDWLELDSFEQIVNVLEKNNYPKIVQFDFREVFENSDIIRNYDFCKKIKKRAGFDIQKNGYYNWKKVKNKFFEVIIPAIWNRVYSRKFIIDNDIKFTNDELGEDSAFTYRALLQDVNIYYLHKYLLNYLKKNTTERVYSKERLASLDYINAIGSHIEKNNLKGVEKSFKKYKLNTIKKRSKQISNQNISPESALELYKSYLTQKEYEKLLKEIKFSSFWNKIYSIKKEKVNGKRIYIVNVFGKTFTFGKIK